MTNMTSQPDKQASQLPAGLTDYVARVRSIVSSRLSPRTVLRRVSDAKRQLLAGPLEIGPDFRRVPATGYGRNLIYEDPDHGFVIVAMSWPPDVGGAPHDHGTWGVVGVVEGSLRVTDFEREDDGSLPGHAALRSLGTIEATPGAVACVLPPHEDYHQIRNESDTRPALSLHTYGRDIARCHLFDLETGKIQVVEPSYTNVVS